MRLIRLISAGLILFVSAPAFAQEWLEYVDRKEHFQINFPGQPTAKDIQYPSEDGETLPARVYTTKEGPATYSLTVVNYKDADAGVYRASTAWAAWQFRKRGGEVTYDAYAVTDRIAGHQLQITNKDGSRSYIGIHPNARRLYIMEASAPPDYPPPSDFPQTLSVLDDQGHRIRYELDDEGNRIGQDEDGRRLYESVQ
jgi:hypothetical protein